MDVQLGDGLIGLLMAFGLFAVALAAAKWGDRQDTPTGSTMDWARAKPERRRGQG
jgi:hypothetical protein